MGLLSKRGYEVLSRVKRSLPIGYKRPEPLDSVIARLVKGHLARSAQEAGAESFDDSQDFEMGDGDPVSPHEVTMADDELDFVLASKKRREAALKARPKAAPAAAPAAEKPEDGESAKPA